MLANAIPWVIVLLGAVAFYLYVRLKRSERKAKIARDTEAQLELDLKDKGRTHEQAVDQSASKFGRRNRVRRIKRGMLP